MLLYTSNSDVYVKMGNCFEKLEKYQTAIEYWNKAIDLDPMNSDAFINLGNYYYKKNKIETAIGYWLASLVSMPEEPTANLNLAVAYTFKKMDLEAFIYYEKYLKYAQNKTSEKYIQIENKISKNKKLANNYLKLGIQYQASEKKLSALKCYQRASKYCPTFSKSYLNIGSLYYADKKYEQAAQYWLTSFYLDPNYTKILCNLALCYDILQEYDLAFCFYSRYGNKIISNQNEYTKVISRCHKIKPVLNSNQYLITRHLDYAKEAFADCDYYKAMTEFTNYIILNPKEQEHYLEMIKKIENFLKPERNIINACITKGRELVENREFDEAKAYFARVLVLAQQGSMEYKEAKRKLGVCLQRSL
jgi:tetratricopeptide (TPR) repeat protein